MSNLGVYTAICAVSRDLSKVGVKKDGTNKMQNYKFRGIDAIYNALSPALVAHGLLIMPRCIERITIERETKQGGTIFYTTVKAEFDFIAVSDGSKHTVVTYGEAMDTSDKSTNKAMSAAYKYAAFQTFCIPTEGDNDADSSHHEIKPKSGKMSIDNNRLQNAIEQIKAGKFSKIKLLENFELTTEQHEMVKSL